MDQKHVFLQSEADAWFERNKRSVSIRNFATDDTVTAAIVEIAQFPRYGGKKGRLQILEIGCGEGRRLSWLAENLDADVFGVEPSSMAVERACAFGVQAQRGTADDLPFESSKFDIVIFGFCLYLCDRQDLFRIAQEANRVLKPDAWLVINDFFAPTPSRRKYHHKLGVYSYKMDYRVIFDWHPDYTCYAHKLKHHGQSSYTDDAQEWVATSVLRKKIEIGE